MCRAVCSVFKRRISTETGKLGNLTARLFEQKLGTGSGPFVEIPEVEKLPRSNFLFQLPRNTTMHGSMNNISLIAAPRGNDTTVSSGEPLLTVTNSTNSGRLPLLVSNTRPVNLVADTAVPTSHVHFVRLDSDTAGGSATGTSAFAVNATADASVLYYSGSVHRSAHRSPLGTGGGTGGGWVHLTGYGLAALRSNTGPVHAVALAADDVVTCATRSLLGMDTTCTVLPETPTAAGAPASAPATGPIGLLSRCRDAWHRAWQPETTAVRGPGTVLLQSE